MDIGRRLCNYGGGVCGRGAGGFPSRENFGQSGTDAEPGNRKNGADREIGGRVRTERPRTIAAFGRLEPTAFKAENRTPLAATEGFFEEISEEFFESFSEEGEGAGACMTTYAPMPARNDKR